MNTEQVSRIIRVILVHGHVMSLNIKGEDNVHKTLKQLEASKKGGTTMLFRDAHSGCAECCIDGKLVVGWETIDPSRMGGPQVIRVPASTMT